MKMTLSIVIPTFNEERYLPLLLKSIKAQDYKDYEIIVADANSKDATRKIARKYGCRIVEGGLPAKGRNNGAKQATGDIIIFLDSDVILPKGFLSENIGKFNKKNLVCASVWANPISNKPVDYVLFFVAQLGQGILQLFRPAATGWCILIKKSVFKKIGGFNEKILVGEDYDLAYRTYGHGRFAMLINPNLYVSVRRLEKEGRFNFAMKVLKTTFYDVTGKKMTVKNKAVEYDFGGYEKIKMKKLPENLNK
jgi:glycosyltransferase involved in cell wall biosynthesis